MSAPAGPARGHSLRTRLLLLLFGAVAVFAAIQGVSAYRGALQQADALFDYHLQQMAHSLRGARPLPPDAGMDDDMDVLVQIWGPDGVQLFRSPRSVLPPGGVLGFSDVRVQGTAYRVYTVQTPLQTVQIAQNMSERNARARALAAEAALPATLMAPLLMLVVWLVVSRSLAPVERVRRQVAARAADDLSPLPDAGLPDEVRPLVQELNGLFGRVQAAFTAQQHFVADAAHELRSPLAALKLQAQALRGHGADDDAGPGEPATPSREATVQRLNQGIDRAIRLAEQLLALARAEGSPLGTPGAPGTGTGIGTAADAAVPVDLREVIQEAVGDVLPLAQAAGIDLGLVEGAADVPARIQGDAQALRALVRNLLDNAIKYTPAPGQVDVDLRLEGAQVRLTVEDSGPGIAPAERGRVFDRFYRAPGAQAATTTSGSLSGGSGLGLAIVQAIAKRHQAAVQLSSSARLGGLCVEVRFARLEK